MCDRLKLQRLLLRVMRGKDLIEDDDSTVTVARGEHQALPIWGPEVPNNDYIPTIQYTVPTNYPLTSSCR